MGITIADLQAHISADTSNAEAAIARFGKGITGLGPLALTATAGLIGAFAGAALTIGKAALDAADSYDKAFDSIRVATGKVGDDAKHLQDVFRDVFTSLPTTTEKAAEAVGFLSARLKLTGKDLADLAKAEIELARITGGDLNSQLKETARLFKDFEVSKPVEALDYLFKVSQQTGTKITEVAASLVAYGAPLRGLGFDFKEAAALIAKFQAEGVELGKVLPGLRQALASLAKEGVKDAGEAFNKLVQGIKDAPTHTEAVGLAIAAFGKRAGPDLAEAIRQGRFSLDDLKKSVNESTETIVQAAKDTNDYAESWTIMWNKVTDALVPAGDKIRQFLADMIKGLTDLFAAYQSNWGEIKSTVDQAIKDITGFYKDHKTEIDLLAQAVTTAVGIIVKLWAENAKLILESISVITLGMRVAAGDWGAAWTQYNEMAKKEQEKGTKQANDFFNAVISRGVAFGTAFIHQMLKIYESTVETWAKIKEAAERMWEAIADAVWGPIKRVYDKLKSLDWGTIFKYMTEAAKRGLEVRSPPIIAVWVSQIGDAALKAAAQTKKSVPSFSDSFKSLSASAKQHLPAVAQEYLKMAETVLDVIGKIKAIDLGSVFGGGTPATAGTGTPAKGGFLGALGKLAEGVGGIASIFGGVDSIIQSIKSIFGIKSAFQKAMEAEQIAQAKLQTQQSQQTVLQMIEQTKQSWIETLDKGRLLLESIAFYSKVPKLAFNQFFRDMDKLFKGMVELAKKWKLDATVDIKTAAENLGAGVALLSQLPAALDGISKYLGTPDASFITFFAAAAKYFDKLEEFLDTIPKSTAKAIGKFSNWLKSGVDLLAPLTDGLKGLLDLKDLPTDAQFELVNKAIDKIITNIGLLGQKFDKGMLKQMAFFSEKAGSALALWKDTIDAIKATIGIQPLSETDADNLISGLTLFIDKLTIGLGKLNTEELTRVASIASTILPIAGALKAWADTSAAVRGYTMIAAEAWDAIIADFTKAIQLMGVLISQAMLFESMAITLETHLKSGAQHLADGINAMAGAVVGTASALQTNFGHIQGGVGTTAVGGSYGAMSLAPAGATAGGSVTVGAININGTGLSSAQLQDAIVGALVKIKQRGRLS